MRVAIKLEPECDFLTVPIYYNHIVQSMIYSNIDEVLADELHRGGYLYGKRKFKLFTFSRLMSKVVRINRSAKELELKSPVELKIGSVDERLLESLAIHLIKKRVVRLGKSTCIFSSIEVEMPPEVGCPTLVRAISPITVRRTLYTADGKKKSYYFNPWEREFSQLIMDNLKRKASSWLKSKPPPIDNSYIKPVRVSKKNEAIINFKGFWIKGWMGIYELNLPEPYFILAYNAGLGARNSQGFGMIEVVKEVGDRKG